jgi:DNA invertase Pin-like site-specific DNA recombinase
MCHDAHMVETAHKQRTAVAYYRTSSATNVGQVSIRQKSPPDPPLLRCGSPQDGYQCTASAYAKSEPLHSDKDSLIRQQEAVRGYAANRGLHIVREFYDAAVSGADPIDARPQFPELMKYMLGNGARTIIVENASRFARDLIVQETGYQMLKAKGIELIASDSPDSFISDTPTATFIRQVLGAVSQLEKTMLVQKLRGARDRKSAMMGERVEGRRDWKALRNPDAILAARDAYARGLSLRKIAAELAEKNIRAASGKVYGPQSIKRMLGTS